MFWINIILNVPILPNLVHNPPHLLSLASSTTRQSLSRPLEVNLESLHHWCNQRSQNVSKVGQKHKSQSFDSKSSAHSNELTQIVVWVYLTSPTPVWSVRLCDVSCCYRGSDRTSGFSIFTRLWTVKWSRCPSGSPASGLVSGECNSRGVFAGKCILRQADNISAEKVNSYLSLDSAHQSAPLFSNAASSKKVLSNPRL